MRSNISVKKKNLKKKLRVLRPLILKELEAVELEPTDRKFVKQVEIPTFAEEKHLNK
jgi:hypothetical protein